MLLRELGLTSATANDLRKVPVEALLGSYYRVGGEKSPDKLHRSGRVRAGARPRPTPSHPFDPAAPRQARDIPLLIGSNAEDMSFFTGNDPGVRALDEAGS